MNTDKPKGKPRGRQGGRKPAAIKRESVVYIRTTQETAEWFAKLAKERRGTGAALEWLRRISDRN